MEKLDRLGWAAGIAFSSYGVRFGIRTNDPEILSSLEQYLPPKRRPLSSPVVQELYSLRVASSAPGSRVRQMNLAYSGVARLARGPELLPVLEALETDLMLRVAEKSRRIFVDAGVVGWGDGVLMILGQKGSGRSHLVRCLVEAGARFFSDRCAVLDERGTVYPYPSDIVVAGGEEGTPERLPVPKNRTAHRGVPLMAILDTEFQPCRTWRFRSKSEGHTLLTLLRYALPTRIRPEATLRVLKEVAARAPIHCGARGEAEEMLPRLAELYGGFPKVAAGKLSPRSGITPTE